MATGHEVKKESEWRDGSGWQRVSHVKGDVMSEKSMARGLEERRRW